MREVVITDPDFVSLNDVDKNNIYIAVKENIIRGGTIKYKLTSYENKWFFSDLDQSKHGVTYVSDNDMRAIKKAIRSMIEEGYKVYEFKCFDDFVKQKDKMEAKVKDA